MFYRNARIFTSDFQFHMGAFSVEGDRFGAILPEQVPENAIDLQGATVIPGLVDIHCHGSRNADFSDGDYAGLLEMARYLLQSGITAFAPASMTLPYPVLEHAYQTAAAFHARMPEDCARLMGIHMEGPYFSEKKKGAQNAAYLQNPDPAGFRALYAASEGLIRIADVAPELPGAMDFIREVSRICTVSVAHTDADYLCAAEAFASGATHLTHLFNAMPGIHHRNPGVIPAVVENPAVCAELICDGLHVHPSAVRMAFSLFGASRIVLISDALRCCGMPEGEYTLGGQDVTLKDGIARLPDGTIAGSASNLYFGMKNAMAFGISEASAVRCATYNPACAIGAQDQIGSIREGLYADFLICTDSYESCRVFRGGAEIC